MRALIGCERSGVVRREFERLGHDVYSCDLVRSEDDSPRHWICDVREALRRGPWDLFLVFPDCTFVCGSGLHWNKRRPGREEKTAAAVEFADEMLSADVPRIALENPVGRLGTAIREPEQTIQPYLFGEDASKRTCLWLKGLRPLMPTCRVPGRWVLWKGKWVERWANQTDSGQNRLGPSETRAMDRARTYPGVAAAFALQWGAT